MEQIGVVYSWKLSYCVYNSHSKFSSSIFIFFFFVFTWKRGDIKFIAILLHLDGCTLDIYLWKSTHTHTGYNVIPNFTDQIFAPIFLLIIFSFFDLIFVIRQILYVWRITFFCFVILLSTQYKYSFRFFFLLLLLLAIFLLCN